jgi:SAM-dependent methyltransferase
MELVNQEFLKDGSFYDYDYFDNPDPPVGIGYRGYSEKSINCTLVDLAIALFKPTTCIDLGCAKGYYVDALRKREVKAWGADISTYAIEHAPEDLKRYLFRMDALEFCEERPFRVGMPRKTMKFDLIFMQDLLEHLEEEKGNKLMDLFPEVAENLFTCFAALPHDNDPRRAEYEEEWKNAQEHICMLPWDVWDRKFQNMGIPYFVIYSIRFGHWNPETVIWKSNIDLNEEVFNPAWEAFVNTFPG